MTTPADIKQRRADEAAYARYRTRQMAYGRWNPWTDAEPVRNHLRMLAAHNIGAARAADLANVARATVSYWLWGHRPYPAPKQISTELAARVLAVRPDLNSIADRCHIDATVTRRKLQALVADGFPAGWLATRVQRDPSNFSRTVSAPDTVEASTARSVNELYNQLAGTAPASWGIAPRAITYATNWGAKKGWYTTAQWDGEIENPDADPSAWTRVDNGRHSAEALVEDAAFIQATTGVSLDLVAERLGVAQNTLNKARERAAARRRAAAGTPA